MKKFQLEMLKLKKELIQNNSEIYQLTDLEKWKSKEKLEKDYGKFNKKNTTELYTLSNKLNKYLKLYSIDHHSYKNHKIMLPSLLKSQTNSNKLKNYNSNKINHSHQFSQSQLH